MPHRSLGIEAGLPWTRREEGTDWSGGLGCWLGCISRGRMVGLRMTTGLGLWSGVGWTVFCRTWSLLR